MLALLEQGLKQKEIALRLHVSPNTVSRHLQNVYGKLGVHNMTQALNKARTLRSAATSYSGLFERASP